MSKKVKIEEIYSGNKPTINIYNIVKNLMKYVPEKYFGGLKKIIIKNNTHENKKSKDKILGSYFHQSRNNPAYIELYIDEIIDSKWPSILLFFPLIKYLLIANILYHEIGHHIHRMHKKKYSNPEKEADDWHKELIHNFLEERYIFVYPFYKKLKFLTKTSVYNLINKKDLLWVPIILIYIVNTYILKNDTSFIMAMSLLFLWNCLIFIEYKLLSTFFNILIMFLLLSASVSIKYFEINSPDIRFGIALSYLIYVLFINKKIVKNYNLVYPIIW